MRDRKKQRELRKLKEKRLEKRDVTGLLDLTPYEAVERIIRKEKQAANQGEEPSGEVTTRSESEQVNNTNDIPYLTDPDIQNKTTERPE